MNQWTSVSVVIWRKAVRYEKAWTSMMSIFFMLLIRDIIPELCSGVSSSQKIVVSVAPRSMEHEKSWKVNGSLLWQDTIGNTNPYFHELVVACSSGKANNFLRKRTGMWHREKCTLHPALCVWEQVPSSSLVTGAEMPQECIISIVNIKSWPQYYNFNAYFNETDSDWHVQQIKLVLSRSMNH